MKRWQLQEAKARLSEVVKLAQREGPQGISVRGEPAVVVVSAEEFERLAKRKPKLVDLLAGSPWAGVELDIRRDRSPAKPPKL